MHMLYDPDEWETVVDSRLCTACGGDLRKCDGRCNGMTSYGQRRRTPEEVAKIKEAKQHEHERNVLAEADAIRARRSVSL